MPCKYAGHSFLRPAGNIEQAIIILMINNVLLMPV